MYDINAAKVVLCQSLCKTFVSKPHFLKMAKVLPWKIKKGEPTFNILFIFAFLMIPRRDYKSSFYLSDFCFCFYFVFFIFLQIYRTFFFTLYQGKKMLREAQINEKIHEEKTFFSHTFSLSLLLGASGEFIFLSF